MALIAGYTILPPQPPQIIFNSSTGGLSGLYQYAFTYQTAFGESLPSTSSPIISITGSANIIAIPYGPSNVTEINIYRSLGNDLNYVLNYLDTINNFNQHIYYDNFPDSTLVQSIHPAPFSTADPDNVIQGFCNITKNLLASINTNTVPGDAIAIKTTLNTLGGSYNLINPTVAGKFAYLPFSGALEIGSIINIRNIGANAVGIQAPAGQTIDGAVAKNLAVGGNVTIMLASLNTWLSVTSGLS